MTYPTRIPRGTQHTTSTNPVEKRGGRDDMSGKLKNGGKGNKSTGYGGDKSPNTTKAAHNRKGNSLARNIVGRGYPRNQPNIKTGEITNASAETIKKIG